MIYHKVLALQKVDTSFLCLCVWYVYNVCVYVYDTHMICVNGICIVLYMAYIIFVWCVLCIYDLSIICI